MIYYYIIFPVGSIQRTYRNSEIHQKSTLEELEGFEVEIAPSSVPNDQQAKTQNSFLAQRGMVAPELIFLKMSGKFRLLTQMIV